MQTALCDLRGYVEPGALPKRVRFYAGRRKLEAVRALPAFFVGLAAGCIGTCFVVIVLALCL